MGGRGAPGRAGGRVQFDPRDHPGCRTGAGGGGSRRVTERVGPGHFTDHPENPADALEAGITIADAEADRGTDLILLAVPGVGADAALAVSVLTNTEPVKVLSRGAAATDPEAWMAWPWLEVRDQRLEAIKHRDNADALLAAIGSPRLAAAAGLALRAAGRRTPVVLDSVRSRQLARYWRSRRNPVACSWWSAATTPDPTRCTGLR